MSVYYLDSSAWVKRYFHEPGEDRLHELFDSPVELASTSLGHVEVISAIARQGALRNLNTAFTRAQLRDDWRSLIQLALTGDVMRRAEMMAQHFRLRGADAVHLAATGQLIVLLRHVAPVVLLTADHEMLEAAARLKISTEDPATGVTRFYR